MRDCRFSGLFVRRQKATPLTLTFSLGKREVGALTEQERTLDNTKIVEKTNHAPSNNSGVARGSQLLKSPMMKTSFAAGIHSRIPIELSERMAYP